MGEILIFFTDKHIRQSTLDKLWNKQTGAIQMLLSILEVIIINAVYIILLFYDLF